ncbi:MAG: DNA replication/repair protein RecF [Eubacteriales bacterium]
MKIISFEAREFRNHTRSFIEFSDGVNVITGKNGAGKTNLLEGIFLFASGKSFRGQKDRDLISFGSECAVLKLVFEDKFSTHTLEACLYKNKKRRLLREGLEIKKLSEYLGLFRAVVFTPDHLRIIKSSPENRRRFLDMAICQAFPRFVASLSEYNRLLIQKNNLLKTTLTPLSSPMLDVYNEKLAHLSSIITCNRFNYVERLREKAGEYLSDLTGGGEKMEISYVTQCGRDFTREKLRENCINLFAKKRQDEILRKATLCGCHHDDFEVFINGKNAKLYASQGQQRSAVISLKLAEGALAKQYTGEDGVFLFDDVLSELDGDRRRYITEKLKGRQFLITGCGAENAGERTFAVEGGKINVSSSG